MFTQAATSCMMHSLESSFKEYKNTNTAREKKKFLCSIHCVIFNRNASFLGTKWRGVSGQQVNNLCIPTECTASTFLVSQSVTILYICVSVGFNQRSLICNFWFRKNPSLDSSAAAQKHVW